MTEPESEQDARPPILLVTSGYHLYREYLLELVAGAARVHLLCDAEPTWEKRYITGWTLVDTLDPAAMTAAARELTGAGAPQGVLCWDEIRMEQTARVQQALGLPGSPPEAVARCRDKHRTRTALAEARVPQAASVLVSSPAEAHQAAEHIGYPVICKPRALGASFGVSAVETPDGLAAGFAEARGATEDGVPYFEAGVLIEEYLRGEEISVDSAVVGGEVVPMFVARKISGFDPYFEEVGHSVDAADPLLTDPALLEVLAGAHRAVGYTTGVTHTELRLTADGPKVIEINSRLGGDLIPRVGLLATGVDPGAVAVAVATGRPLPERPATGRTAAVHFLYPPADCVVREVTVDEDGLPPQTEVVGVLASPGQELRLPPAGHVTSRYAYVITAAADAGTAAAAAVRAAEAVRVHGREGS
ncbi:MAG TPA: ATP-grasp domain-containing protein [Streptomyces sp.]|nr:ATP-grasp domain-containing protein [Streptomyces sp.]